MAKIIVLFHIFFQDFFVAVPVLAVLGSLLFMGLFYAPKVVGVIFIFYFGVLFWYVHSLTTGFENFYRYIHTNGIPGELVISDYVDSGNTFNDVQVLEATGYLKTSDGQMIDLRFLSDPRPQYPILKNFYIRTNVVYKIRYLKGYPKVFVVDNGSQEKVNRQNLCIDLKERLPDLTAKLLLEPQNEQLVKEKAELESQIQSTCSESQ